jgi:hypothetical protein
MSYLDRPQEDWEMGQDAEYKRLLAEAELRGDLAHALVADQISMISSQLDEIERLSNVECDLRLANEALAARLAEAHEAIRTALLAIRVGMPEYDMSDVVDILETALGTADRGSEA